MVHNKFVQISSMLTSAAAASVENAVCVDVRLLLGSARDEGSRQLLEFVCARVGGCIGSCVRVYLMQDVLS